MTIHRLLSPCLIAVAASLWGCSKPSDTVAVAAPPTAALRPALAASEPTVAAHVGDGIAWQHASSEAEVDRAFAEAKSAAKPMFVYWGAAWCPPCNQVKATLFNRQDFIQRSRAFVPVYIDGDSPGAQKLAARFKVSGYPTMVLFDPRGVELTRLPGEVEATRYIEVLTLGMNAERPVSEVLPRALAGGAGLTPNDWRLLAFYSWGTDQQRLLPPGGLPALLQKLAAACPPEQAELSQRLRLQSLAAFEDRTVRPDAAAETLLLQLLGDPAAARSQMDLLTNSAADITRTLTASGTPQRQRLQRAFDLALTRFEADSTLSRADRLGALSSRVELVKIDVPKEAPKATSKERRTPVPMPAALLADVRDTAARDDREITDGYERQAVITAAADALQEAGLGAEAEALLRANLAKSHSPYYLMSALAALAKQRGDHAAALDWYAQAFARSEGPATRLQWGASYVGALVDMAPQNEAEIERAATQLFEEAAALPDAFDGRSGRSLQRIGTRLQAWNHGNRHRAAVDRLQARLGGVCAGLTAGDPNRASCDTLLKPAASARRSPAAAPAA